MSMKRAIGRSVVWNAAGLVVEAVTGFLVMPFLIIKLGQATYGVWIVLGALTSYFGLLDLGLRGALGRYVAFHRSSGNQEGVNQTLTVGLTVLTVVGSVVVTVVVVCEPLFFRLFTVPADEHGAVGLALRLVAVNFALSLLCFAFEAVLWGFQRFDWLNTIAIPATVLRAVLTFALIGSGGGLVVLALITLGVTVAEGLAKAVVCFRIDPGLRVGPRHLSRSALRSLLGYGTWALIFLLARTTRTQLSPLLIGAQLGTAMVTPYSVAARLLSLVGAAVGASVGVLTPFATVLHATGQEERQRRLFVLGGRYACALSAFLIAFLLALGGPLIRLWVGPAFAQSVPLLVVLALGELLPATQWATYSVLNATARHRSLGVLGILEVVGVCALALALLPVLGLLGVGVAMAVPAFLARGLGPMVQGCWVVGVPVRRYLAEAIVPPLLCAAVPAAAVGLVAEAYPPLTWAWFIGYAAGYAALFAAGYAALFERDRLKRFLRRGDRRSALPSGSDDGGPGSAEPEPGEGNSGFKSPAGGLG